jgi:glycerol-3-phosphate acyltransferase PlsY
MVYSVIIAALLGYFLGALPFGWLVARANGVDIFEVGSKSPGATNVKRSVGSNAGNLVFALDALKGAGAAYSPRILFSSQDIVLQLSLLAVVCAIVGHSFSCFTRFKGGKGVATAAGSFFVLMPYLAAFAIIFWVILFYTSRYVSVASIGAALALPLAAYFTHQENAKIFICTASAIFIIVRHRTNIKRLISGTENRWNSKK